MTPLLPHRGDGRERPTGLPLPPRRMAPLRGGRPLKRWTYVGAWGPELMLCAARVRIAGLPQAFWAVLDRSSGELVQRTAFAPGLVAVGDGHLSVRGRGVEIELTLRPTGEPVEVVSPHGASYIWTRKQPVRAAGLVVVGARTRRIECAGLVDSSAGYHARETAWSWAAGVGEATDGRALCWNLVSGIHDAPQSSERTVWIDGEAREIGPVGFLGDLEDVAFSEDGAALRFTAEAQRARRDDLWIFASDYRQPFGSFSGSLPGGVELASGCGVMERHEARW